MRHVLLATRYVKAFSNCFDNDNDKVKQLQALDRFISKIKLESDTIKMLDDPTVSLSKKIKVLNLYVPKANKMLINFLSLLVKKDRFFLISDMEIVVERMIYGLKNQVSATAYASASLQASDKSTIIAYLKSYFNKDVDLNMIVDESILAGVRVESNNIIFDATLDNSLKNLKLAFQ